MQSSNPIKARVLILYTELAAYTIACINAASRNGFEMHVVRWPVNSEAPFQFDLNEAVYVYEREDYGSDELIEIAENIQPDLVLLSGWIDKGYLKTVNKTHKYCPSVLMLDNPWSGNLRQRLAALGARISITRYFQYCWVPGDSQSRFARALGFAVNKIEKGVYSADLEHFNEIYNKTMPAKQADFPRRFLYVGRYVDFKGIHELWQAFRAFRKSHSEWELWCVGTGELFDDRDQSEGIRHFGFLQPQELEDVVAQAGVFILPSRKEPWGVVVHEFAAAGFPMICSNKVGASEAFVKENVNGYFHDSGSAEQIKTAMDRMAEKSNEELLTMALASHRMAQKISPETWADTLPRFMHK